MPIFPSGKSRIAITLGDPAGVGPEVALKALNGLKSESSRRVLLLGRAGFFSDLARRLKLSLSFRDVESPEEAFGLKSGLPCFFDRDFPLNLGRPGRPSVHAARLAIRSIELAVDCARKGIVGGMVTPPIHKAGFRQAGFLWPGHTECLATLSKTKRVEMMLVGGSLRVVPVTRHVSLKKVPGLLSRRLIEDAIVLTAKELKQKFGIRRPRLAVCGLNPHAGEEGLLGDEEARLIEPAVRSAKKKIQGALTGPLSPDALFVDAYQGRYDAVICMYHDQGLIPLKMISRGHGVNVTLGLPFVRTSPDHGTAYDIAGAYRADPGSMIEAIRLALRLTRRA